MADDTFYRLDLSLSRYLSVDLDEDAAVLDLHADIVCHDGGTDSRAGSVRAYIIRPDQLPENVGLFGACDAHSQTMCDYAVALFDTKTGEIKESVDRVFEGVMNPNVLILDTIELLPAHRGRRVGLLAAWHFIELFETGCGFVACEPFPMQYGLVGEDVEWRARMGVDAFGGDKATARAKLVAYWSRLGFRAIPGTKLLGINLAMQRPTLRDTILDC